MGIRVIRGAIQIGRDNKDEVMRIMAHVQSDTPRKCIEHICLRGAAALRLDLAQ